MTEAAPESLAIGQVAAQAGLPTSTLRFYERAGLLPAPERVAGRRRYDAGIHRRLAVIDVAQRSGFTIAEIRRLLAALDAGASASECWREMATGKLPEVQALIQRVHAMKRLLEHGPASGRLAGADCGFPSPFAYRRGQGLVHATFLFDTLLWKDSNGTLIPWLAKRWKRSADGCEWNFTLRSDVAWHDGQPLTGEDVVFTFDYLTAGPGRRSGAIHLHGLDSVKHVVAKSRDVVVFRLHRPYAPFEDWVAGRMLVIPEHVWSTVEDPVGYRGPGAVTGSGPYRLESCSEANGRYTYVANEAFFLGSPYLRRLEFLPIPDPITALKEGEIDIAYVGGDEGIPRESLADFNDTRYHRIERAGEQHLALHFNLKQGFPFAQKRFRQALAYGIDRAELVRKVLYGRGEPGSMGGMSPTHPLTPDDLATYDYDVDKANALLDELGLRRSNPRAVRRMPDGSAFLPTLQVSTSSSTMAVQLLQDHLRQIGVKTRIKRLHPRIADMKSAAGDYEMALVYSGALGGDPDWLRIRLSGDVQVATHARIHGYENRNFEALANRQSTVIDPAERAELVREMQRILADDVPMISLYVPTRITLFLVKSIFDAWHFTTGGVWGGYPGPLNKHAFVSGNTSSSWPLRSTKF